MRKQGSLGRTLACPCHLSHRGGRLEIGQTKRHDVQGRQCRCNCRMQMRPHRARQIRPFQTWTPRTRADSSGVIFENNPTPHKNRIKSLICCCCCQNPCVMLAQCGSFFLDTKSPLGLCSTMFYINSTLDFINIIAIFANLGRFRHIDL